MTPLVGFESSQIGKPTAKNSASDLLVCVLDGHLRVELELEALPFEDLLHLRAEESTVRNMVITFPISTGTRTHKADNVSEKERRESVCESERQRE